MVRGATFPVSRLSIAFLSILAFVSATSVVRADLLQSVGDSGRIPLSGLQFNTSHRGAVTHLDTWRGGSLLVSAGADGTLRVWDPRDGILKYSVSLGGRPSRLVVHPWLPRAYVALSDVTGEWLIAWDWEEERELFNVSQSNQPLFLGLSRTANLLLVGRQSFDGLWVIDANTGELRSGSDLGTGIVTFAVTSRDEKTLLTYQPGGSLTYRDRVTGEASRLLRAPSNLTNNGLSSDRRFLIGRAGSWLVSIDAVNGRKIDRQLIEDLRLMKIWETEDRVLVVAEDELGPILRLFRIVDGYLEEEDYSRRIMGSPVALAHGYNEIFVGTGEGAILRLDLQDPELSFEVLVRDERLAIIDVAVARNTIVLGTTAGLVTITGDFIEGGPLWLTQGEQLDIKTQVFSNPFGPDADRAVRVTALDSGRVLVWSTKEPGIAVLNVSEARLESLQFPLSAPLLSVDVTGRVIAAVDNLGNATLINAIPVVLESSYRSRLGNVEIDTKLETAFTVRLSGATDVVAGDREGEPALIAALSNFGTKRPSVVSIAISTGETVALPNSSSFVYDLAYSSQMEKLFFIGVRGGRNTGTTLTWLEGRELDQSRALFVSSDEDIHASVVLEEEVGRVFFSLGGQVRLWDGQAIRMLAQTGRQARRLAVHRSRVYAVNADGTLSVWSADKLTHGIDLHVWQNFEWLVTSSDRYWTSKEGAAFVVADADPGGRDAKLSGSAPVLE